MAEAQRVGNRVDVTGRIHALIRCGDEARAGSETTIQVMNLNLGGAALRAAEPVADVLERAALCMRRADDDGEWVECACEVRYVLGENRPDGEPAWLHGVRFVDVPEPAQAFISRVLDGRER